MQPRLTRSTTESMIAGVSGGLGEYFNIDPVIVRLIFVLVTLTSGLGLPVYIVLWMITPKATTPPPQRTVEQSTRQFSDEVAQFGQEAVRLGREVMVGQRQGGASARSGSSLGTQTPAQPEYRFDPMTGQPLDPSSPALGQTVNLGGLPPDLPATVDPQPAPRPGRNWTTLGGILIGIGGLIFLENVGLNMSLVFPILLIVAGVILLRRKR